MNTKQFFSAALAAVFAVIYLPAENVSAQTQDGNVSSTPIDMVVNGGTTEESMQTSQFGIMEPVGLRQDEQLAITLSVSSSKINNPVGIAPLDGGEISPSGPLYVGSNATVSFTFKGGNIPGRYRLVVTIGSEQYRLQFYVVKPQSMAPDCNEP
jgi:hypothetical protein